MFKYKVGDRVTVIQDGKSASGFSPVSITEVGTIIEADFEAGVLGYESLPLYFVRWEFPDYPDEDPAVHPIPEDLLELATQEEAMSE